MCPRLQSAVRPAKHILSNRTTCVTGLILKMSVIFIITGTWEMILLYVYLISSPEFLEQSPDHL